MGVEVARELLSAASSGDKARMQAATEAWEEHCKPGRRGVVLGWVTEEATAGPGSAGQVMEEACMVAGVVAGCCCCCCVGGRERGDMGRT